MELHRHWDFSDPGLQLRAGDCSGFEQYVRCMLDVHRLLAFFTLNTIALRRLIERGCVEQMEEEGN